MNKEIDRLDEELHEQMNEWQVINADVISAPKAGKHTLGILKNSTFLTVLQGQEGLGANEFPKHLFDTVMCGKTAPCPAPTAPLEGAWVDEGALVGIGRTGGGLRIAEAVLCLGSNI